MQSKNPILKKKLPKKILQSHFRWTGIPVSDAGGEMEKLAKAEENLKRELSGRMRRSGGGQCSAPVKGGNRKAAADWLVHQGPTGGKTELAKALASFCSMMKIP
jgi:ATP-dependent Clp protease ATP-binding subunit ClpA